MASRKKPAVPELLKQTLTQKAEQRIEEKFRPGLSNQAEAAQKHGFNYVVEIYTTWRGRYFYFCARYCSPRQEEEDVFFEVRTTRMEYIGDRRFNLAYMRHTGKWQEVFHGLSLEEGLATIESEELFWPVH